MEDTVESLLNSIDKYLDNVEHGRRGHYEEGATYARADLAVLRRKLQPTTCDDGMDVEKALRERHQIDITLVDTVTGEAINLISFVTQLKYQSPNPFSWEPGEIKIAYKEQLITLSQVIRVVNFSASSG